jgi:hypothetical protein
VSLRWARSVFCWWAPHDSHHALSSLTRLQKSNLESPNEEGRKALSDELAITELRASLGAPQSSVAIIMVMWKINNLDSASRVIYAETNHEIGVF